MTTTATRKPTATPARKVVYPTEDGRPMAETDKHRDLSYYAIQALKTHYADREDVYVSGNNFVYWEEGNPKARLSPDTYVVFGVPGHLRDSYKSWEEGGRLPDVVFEFTSKKTQREDTDTKLPRYQSVLRTPEYFLFDPTGDYLRPRLQGYRLEDGRYVRLELVDGRLHSERLGLDVVRGGESLRFFDPAQNRFLLTPLEQVRRADDAEAVVARLRAELEALRSQGL